MAVKEKFELEYLLKTSPKVLDNMISTPSGLSEWFSDDVQVKNDMFTFYWDGSEEKAKLLGKKPNEFIKFQWEEDEGEDYFFELRIQVHPITKEVALLVTDHAETDEVEESKLLWDNQVDKLLHILGA